MILLWSLVVAACLCLAGAGAQTVWLLRDRDGDIARLDMHLTTLRTDVERANKQLEAQAVQIATQRTVLEQAEAWIKAQKAARREGEKRNATTSP